MKPHELFKKITPDLAQSVVRHFREEDARVYANALATLAAQRKLRPVFIQRKSLPGQYAWIVKTLQLKACDSIGEHLFQAWFLAGHQPMLAAFCDAMEIPHDGKGSVQGALPAELDAAKLDAAVDTLLVSFEPRLVALYLHVFNMQAPGGWPALGEKLAGDPRLTLR